MVYKLYLCAAFAVWANTIENKPRLKHGDWVTPTARSERGFCIQSFRRQPLDQTAEVRRDILDQKVIQASQASHSIMDGGSIILASEGKL
jgi:hypothetical protein